MDLHPIPDFEVKLFYVFHNFNYILVLCHLIVYFLLIFDHARRSSTTFSSGFEIEVRERLDAGFGASV